MNIDRHRLLDELDSFARTDHGVVTGIPGVGKTHAILELHARWKNSGLPHLLVPVDRIGSATDEEIRAVLGIDDELLAVAQRLFRTAGERGVIVFDAFDAARSESTRERVLKIIRRAVAESNGLWTVLVTVRTYDVTRSDALRQLFRDRSITGPRAGAGLDETRSFVIPLLSANEVESAKNQIPGLEELAAQGTADFRQLLHVPFNLWLLDQILSAPGSRAAISQASSVAQLLALYWKRRVLASSQPVTVRHVLEKSVRSMVEEKTLSVRRDRIFEPSLEAAWAEALSSGVLIAPDDTEQRIAFAHNILFDYAVSVLLLDDEPRAMESFIAQDPARPFFLRPSISFYFTRLWHNRRDIFWEATLQTIRSTNQHVRLVGRIVPPSVVVHEARELEDIRPLVTGLDHGDEHSAELVLRTIQAFQAAVSTTAAVWVDILAAFGERPNRKYLWETVAASADFLRGARGEVTPHIREAVGRTGRSSLRWALDQRASHSDGYGDALGGYWGVVLTAETFATNSVQSRELLLRVLSLLDEPDFPLPYITRLADQVTHLASQDPELVEQIYQRVFSHAEESEAVTSFGSPILPLRSTRRQDFATCEYILVKDFPAFLQAAPTHATRAAIRAVNKYVLRRRVLPYLREGKTEADLTNTFQFRGKTASVVSDFSGMWRESARDDEPIRLLHSAMQRLHTIASEHDEAAVDTVLDLIADEARVETVWLALLNAAWKTPRELGPKVTELALAEPVLRNMQYDLVRYVEASVGFWSQEAREDLELRIGELRKTKDKTMMKAADLLALALPRELIRSSTVKRRRSQLEKAKEKPLNKHPSTISVSTRSFSNEEWLAEQGVDVEHPAAREYFEEERRLEAVDTEFRNRRATAEELPRIVQHLKEGVARIGTPNDNVAPKIVELLRGKVTALAAHIARADADVPENDLILARKILLDAAMNVDLAAEEDERPYKYPSWSPTPQTEAAVGLAWLALRGQDDEVLNAIEAMSQSAEPSVRYLTALELLRLHRHSPDRLWSIAGRMAERERNSVVLSGLLSSILRLRSNPTRVSKILRRIEERGFLAEGDDETQVIDAYASGLTWLALNVQEPWAVGRFNAQATDPYSNSRLTKRLTFEALSSISAPYLSDPESAPISLRARDWLRILVHRITDLLPTIGEGEGAKEKYELTYALIDEVASRLFYQVRRDEEAAQKVEKQDQLRTYYQAIRSVLEDVVSFGRRADASLLAPTAHHMMELLHVCVAIDPRGVLQLAAQVAVASERSGYNLDSMAVKEVVAIAETLLTDFRYELQEGESLEDFVTLLDTFARAGWPEALRLLWRLDEVFR